MSRLSNHTTRHFPWPEARLWEIQGRTTWRTRDALRNISPSFPKCTLPAPSLRPHKSNLPPLRSRIRRHQRAYRIECGLKPGDLLPRQRGQRPRRGFVRAQQLPGRGRTRKGPHDPDIHLNRPLGAARVGVLALRRPTCGPEAAARVRRAWTIKVYIRGSVRFK